MAERDESKSVRVVFDCNVLLQAMVNPGGPAGECVGHALAGNVTLFLSQPILDELVDVAARPLLVRRFALTPARTAAFIDELLTHGKMIESVPAVFAHPTDPKDNVYIDLAIAANAHVITSRDRHLLSLRDASTKAGADFMARFGSIEVLTPVGLLERLRTA